VTLASSVDQQAKWFYRTMAVCAAAIMIVRAALTIPIFTNAWDEPFNIGAAVAIYDVKKHVMNTEHPPLVPLVAGLPLHLSGVHLPPGYHSTAVVAGGAVTMPAATQIMFHGPLPYRELLSRARYAMLIFPLAVLLYVYLLAAWIGGKYGEWVAMWSVLFVSTDPTLLGHAMWVGTDVAGCAGFLAAVYHGLRWIVQRRTPQAVWAGLAIGLGLSCKFSNLFVLPALLLVMAIQPLPVLTSNVRHKSRAYWRRWPSLRQMALVAVVAFLTLWATYLFNISRMGDQTSFSAHSEWGLIPAWIKQMPMPMPSLPLGILRQMEHSRLRDIAYLNGRLRNGGWWYYYPEAIAIKSPLALLLGLPLAVVVMVVSRRRAIWGTIMLAVPATIYLAAAMQGHIDIGVRLVLPVIPFLYLFVCLQLGRRRTGMTAVLSLLLLLAFVETGRVHPDYLGFFNLLVGGPTNGSRYLADSNLDWGHDIGRLAQWLNSDPAARGRPYTLELFCNPQHDLVQAMGLDDGMLGMPPTLQRGGLVVVSVNLLCEKPEYEWVQRYPLVGKIGTSIEVFDLGLGQPAAAADGMRGIARGAQ
jgi:hypothetical protein